MSKITEFLSGAVCLFLIFWITKGREWLFHGDSAKWGDHEQRLNALFERIEELELRRGRRTMTNEQVYTIRATCDGKNCRDPHGEFYGVSQRAAFSMFRSLGWVEIGDKTFCPDCAAKEKGDDR